MSSSSDVDAGLRKVIIAVTGVGWRLESLSSTLWLGIVPWAEGSRHCCWTMLRVGVAVVSDAPRRSSQRRRQMYAEGYMTHQLIRKVDGKLVRRILYVRRDKRYGSCEHHKPGRSRSTSLESRLIQNNDLSSRNSPLDGIKTNCGWQSCHRA